MILVVFILQHNTSVCLLFEGKCKHWFYPNGMKEKLYDALHVIVQLHHGLHLIIIIVLVFIQRNRSTATFIYFLKHYSLGYKILLTNPWKWLKRNDSTVLKCTALMNILWKSVVVPDMGKQLRKWTQWPCSKYDKFWEHYSTKDLIISLKSFHIEKIKTGHLLWCW